MRPIFFITALAALACLLPSGLLSVPADGISNQIVTVVQPGTYRIVQGDDGQRIVMEGFGYRREPGKPMLPEKRILVALPPGARVQSITYQGIGGDLIPGSWRIQPSPPFFPLAEASRRLELAAGMQREWRENNEAVYSSDAVFPYQIAKLFISTIIN